MCNVLFLCLSGAGEYVQLIKGRETEMTETVIVNWSSGATLRATQKKEKKIEKCVITTKRNISARGSLSIWQRGAVLNKTGRKWEKNAITTLE